MSTELTPADRIAQAGVVPVVELEELDSAAPLIEALLAGGIDTVEITLRTDAGLGAIRALSGSYPEVLVGAGTVRSRDEAHRAIDAGASFVVSPGFDAGIVGLCGSAGVLALPGACTPTELQAALAAGARVIKFFPAEAMGGIPFLRALIAPFRDVRFVPTGGIGPENLSAYLQLPEVVACGGSWLAARSLVRDARFGQIAELAREAVALVAEARNG